MVVSSFSVILWIILFQRGFSLYKHFNVNEMKPLKKWVSLFHLDNNREISEKLSKADQFSM